MLPTAARTHANPPTPEKEKKESPFLIRSPPSPHYTAERTGRWKQTHPKKRGKEEEEERGFFFWFNSVSAVSRRGKEGGGGSRALKGKKSSNTTLHQKVRETLWCVRVIQRWSEAEVDLDFSLLWGPPPLGAPILKRRKRRRRRRPSPLGIPGLWG